MEKMVGTVGGTTATIIGTTLRFMTNIDCVPYLSTRRYRLVC
jgi:hypothetical protein